MAIERCWYHEHREIERFALAKTIISGDRNDGAGDDREAKIAALDEQIEALRKRAGISAEGDDKAADRTPDQDEDEPGGIYPESWSAL